jgi:hypothetical protein
MPSSLIPIEGFVEIIAIDIGLGDISKFIKRASDGLKNKVPRNPSHAICYEAAADDRHSESTSSPM